MVAQTTGRFLLVMVVMLAALGPGSAAGAVEPAAPVQPAALEWRNVELRPVHSDKCVEVPRFSKALRTRLQQWSCNGGSNQRFDIWEVRRDAQGFALVKIRNVHSRLCLNVKGASLAPRVPVIQWHCNNRPATLWKARLAGGLVLTNHNSLLCLNVQGASTRNGAKLIQFGCERNANERFVMGR